MNRCVWTALLLAWSAVVVAAPAAPRTAEVASSLPLTAMQAEKGGPAALLREGEMYWYGNGAPLDRARGDAVFARAAAAGSKEAASALQLSEQRRRHLAAIDWWTAGYQGTDLGVAESACEGPAIPWRSTTMAEAEAVDAAYEAYRLCYNGLVDRLYGAAAAARGQRQAAEVTAAHAAWASHTVADITTHAMRRRQQIANAEANSRAMGQALQDNIRPQRPPPANVTGR